MLTEMERHTMFPDRNTQHHLHISKPVLKFNMVLKKIPQNSFGNRQAESKFHKEKQKYDEE